MSLSTVRDSPVLQFRSSQNVASFGPTVRIRDRNSLTAPLRAKVHSGVYSGGLPRRREFGVRGHASIGQKRIVSISQKPKIETLWSETPPFQNLRKSLIYSGGGMGIRTPDLLIANETLYQLSYTPFTAASQRLAEILVPLRGMRLCRWHVKTDCYYAEKRNWGKTKSEVLRTQERGQAWRVHEARNCAFPRAFRFGLISARR
jgi:hypothetical protein